MAFILPPSPRTPSRFPNSWQELSVRNLVAHPHVTVEALGEEYPAEASVLSGADREQLWTQITASYPFFVDHQVRASPREIPLVALTRLPA